jgi:DNA repair protein RecO (recombination protein O)
MAGPIKTEAVVLRSIRYGEADRILHLYTPHRGKVSAIAKGVRRTKSRFGGRLEPTSHVAVLLYSGRELDVVTQVDRLEHFRAIREDLDRLARATALLEASDQVAQERQPNPRLYEMLVGALRAVAMSDAPLLVAAYFWKLLSLEGFHPVLDRCVACGSTESLSRFDLDRGGVVCWGCGDGGRPARLSPTALELVRLLLGGGMAEALNRPAGPATAEVERLATRAVEHHLERRLRSVHLLDRA